MKVEKGFLISVQTCGFPLTAVPLLPMVHREHVGLGHISSPHLGKARNWKIIPERICLSSALHRNLNKQNKVTLSAIKTLKTSTICRHHLSLQRTSCARRRKLPYVVRTVWVYLRFREETRDLRMIFRVRSDSRWSRISIRRLSWLPASTFISKLPFRGWSV